MATSLQTVYDAFLAKVLADDWMLSSEESEDALTLAKNDWRMILDAAIFAFRYPRIPLDISGDSFIYDLGNDEIQVLSKLMKLEWVRRCVATWDNLRQLYSDKDYSPANFLDKLNNTESEIEDECRLALDRYGRAEFYQPNKLFKKLAGR